MENMETSMSLFEDPKKYDAIMKSLVAVVFIEFMKNSIKPVMSQ